MKKTIFLSSIALLFCACGNNEYSIPEAPQPIQEQSFLDYLNNYQYPEKCFRKKSHNYCIQKPLKTIYSKGNEVLLQYDNMIEDDQELNLYHLSYRYCNAIGGKSIIKKQVLPLMVRHKKPLIENEIPQVEEFIKLGDNYSYYELPDGIFECQAGDKSFEITDRYKNFSFFDNGDRFNDWYVDVAALFIIKFKTPQNAPFVGRDNYYYTDKEDEISWIKMDAPKIEALDDRTYFHRILPLYHICKTRYNGTPYIIGEPTEYKAMLLGDFLLDSVKYGGSAKVNYTISCVNDTRPFTLKQTFNGKLERYVNDPKNDYYTYYSRPAAYYELVSKASNLKELEVPFEQSIIIDKLLEKFNYNAITEIRSTLYHKFSAGKFYTSYEAKNGYIGVLVSDKTTNIDKAIYSYKIENGKRRYVGKVGEKEIAKAKAVVAKNIDMIRKNQMSYIKNYELDGYTIDGDSGTIFVMKGDIIHYLSL